MKRIFLFIGSLLSIAIILIGIHLSRLPHGRLIVDFLDIGQGDAILITTPEGNRILVDGGPGQLVLQELGDVMPVLHKRIDLLVLTHPHADHLVGLIPVLERYDVGTVLFSGLNYNSAIYDQFLIEIRTREIPIYVAQANQDWKLGDVALDILYPFDSMVGRSLSNVNNGSVVIKVIYDDYQILLTGDAELEVEEELVTAHDNEELDLQADILKVGHHGSRTSSSSEFLERVKPEIAIIQCGKSNDFGHPHVETLEKFANLGLNLRRNDLEGRVRLTFPPL
ncbi:MAG: ComEC/Rec2 family competence protein [Candidatus Peregrinibacteria bacterium]|nr:ComEC/Rec2 family competence protein [Candidatus Peregrinibacteria bacterium]